MMMRKKISMATTSAAVQELQTCICGWNEVTTRLGLKIHQGCMKCLRETRSGPRIDHYLLRERSSKANEAQRQDLTHSPPSINIPGTVSDSSTSGANLELNQPQPAMEKNIQGHRHQVKSCSKKEWATINADLTNILGRLSGTVDKKLEKRGDLIYSYGAERFGLKQPRKKIKKNDPTQVQKTMRDRATC